MSAPRPPDAPRPPGQPRPLPWSALIEALGERSFEAMRSALAAAGTDAADRDAFVLDAAVGRVLRDLVPADAPAAAVMRYGALLQALYLHWSHGLPVCTLERDAAAALLLAPPPLGAGTAAAPATTYVQLPERLVWATPAPGAPHEPMDGIFVHQWKGGTRALAVLGFRPDRQGFTTLEAEAAPGARLEPRPDGSRPFSTVLPAGERMGFFSVTTASELTFLALLALAVARG